MPECPFLSTYESAVECYKECPLFSCKENGGKCPFKSLDFAKTNKFDDVELFEFENELELVKKYF